MNFFTKNRLLFWTFLVLVVINISALVSFFLFTAPAKPEGSCPSGNKECFMFREELNLNPDQIQKVEAINSRYKERAGPIADMLKETRTAMLSELEKEPADTGKVNKLIGQLGMLQMQIQRENVQQYLQLKGICSPDQALKLSTLYRDLYGCSIKNNQGKHRNRNGKGCAPGMNDR